MDSTYVNNHSAAVSFSQHLHQRDERLVKGHDHRNPGVDKTTQENKSARAVPIPLATMKQTPTHTLPQWPTSPSLPGLGWKKNRAGMATNMGQTPPSEAGSREESAQNQSSLNPRDHPLPPSPPPPLPFHPPLLSSFSAQSFLFSFLAHLCRRMTTVVACFCRPMLEHSGGLDHGSDCSLRNTLVVIARRLMVKWLPGAVWRTRYTPQRMLAYG